MQRKPRGKTARLTASAPGSLQTVDDLNARQTKANYYDLVAHPNDSIKSKSTGNFIQLAKPPRNLKVSNDWDVRVGDVLSWSEFRPTETFL